MTKFNFEGIGTHWQIDIYQPISDIVEKRIIFLVKNRVEIFDKTYSRFREDSLIGKMSQESGNFTLPNDAKIMLDLYYDLYKITNGFFTPLVGNLLVDAGYDKKYSLHSKGKLTQVPKWEEIISYKYPNINIKKPTILDFDL